MRVWGATGSTLHRTDHLSLLPARKDCAVSAGRCQEGAVLALLRCHVLGSFTHLSRIPPTQVSRGPSPTPR